MSPDFRSGPFFRVLVRESGGEEGEMITGGTHSGMGSGSHNGTGSGPHMYYAQCLTYVLMILASNLQTLLLFDLGMTDLMLICSRSHTWPLGVRFK